MDDVAAAKKFDMPLDTAWASVDLKKDSWVANLQPEDISELDVYLGEINAGKSTAELTDLSRWPKLAMEISNELESGRGFVVVRGLPIDADELALEKFLLGLGKFLGAPVSQTTDGRFISYIKDLGLDAASPTVRGHQTSIALPFHCDRADVVGLLCVRPAKVGGLSLVASAVQVHDIIARERPDLLAELYNPFPQDRRGEELPDQQPWFLMPVFGQHQGRFVSRYIRRFIESAARFDDAPALSDKQIEALDYVDAVLERDDVQLKLDFQPGDLQLLNNSTIWHSRTAYEDWAEEAGGRLLLRLWLAPPNSRELPEWFTNVYGATASGAIRGGVPSR
ncbi:TauD/TfdA family dioxygenase (plasmid) [Neorhizobium sp. DAR64861/K0K2]|uniref:TauD/TfdA family dioxygenase n=1 Tax=Neorhizobium sp. DAR64861/K0K2 TaxID=3421956 RepID=UPI003D295D46